MADRNAEVILKIQKKFLEDLLPPAKQILISKAKLPPEAAASYVAHPAHEAAVHLAAARARALNILRT